MSPKPRWPRHPIEIGDRLIAVLRIQAHNRGLRDPGFRRPPRLGRNRSAVRPAMLLRESKQALPHVQNLLTG